MAKPKKDRYNGKKIEEIIDGNWEFKKRAIPKSKIPISRLPREDRAPIREERRQRVDYNKRVQVHQAILRGQFGPKARFKFQAKGYVYTQEELDALAMWDEKRKEIREKNKAEKNAKLESLAIDDSDVKEEGGKIVVIHNKVDRPKYTNNKSKKSKKKKEKNNQTKKKYEPKKKNDNNNDSIIMSESVSKKQNTDSKVPVVTGKKISAPYNKDTNKVSNNVKVIKSGE